FLGCRTFFKRLEVDSDRETARADRPPTGADTLEPRAGKNLCIGHHPSDALQEVAEIAPRLETEKIELEQRTQQSLLLRKLGKDVEWRKWDMQEECQRRMYPALAQRLSDIH